MQIRSTGFSHRGGTRKHNEDALLELPEQQLWLVADGMGGYQAGDVASRLTCDTVAEAVQNLSRTLDPAPAMSAAALEQALTLANRRIHDYGSAELAGQTLGSTVVALLLAEGRYHLFWAGDSRGYRLRSGTLTQLSRDHSQVADLVEQGLLQPKEAERHPLAHVITRALGVDACIALDYRTGRVCPGDTFMLCSDGVSKEFSTQNLTRFLGGSPIEDASLAIMHSALVKECNDNISCIIVNVEVGGPSASQLRPAGDRTVPVSGRRHDGS